MEPLKVTTVITCFDAANQPYIDRLLWSLYMQTSVDNEIILVTHEEFIPKISNHIKVKIVIRPKTESCPQFINAGFAEAHPESNVFFYCNDDVFICENSLFVLANLCHGKKNIVNALCNSDNGFSYYADFYFDGEAIPQFLRLEQYQDKLDMLYKWGNMIEKTPCILFPLRWLCIYATAIPADIWRKLNGFDAAGLGRFGAADADFCLRARKLGCYSTVTNNAFILHFGGVTSSKNTNDIERKEERQLFHKKWGFFPEQVQ